MANLCVSSIAHSLVNVANLPIPEHILTPWRELSRRLGHKNICFGFVYIVNSNFRITSTDGKKLDSNPDKSSPSAFISIPTESISDPWAQTEPVITTTGGDTEVNFWRGCLAVEHAGRQLPRVMAEAQQAVVISDHQSLRHALLELIDILDHMLKTFMSFDSQSFSRKLLDQLEFARSIDVPEREIVENEKTANGTQSPSVHLLDAFFSRNMHETRLGKIITEERDWFPALHLQFLESIRSVSILDYLESLDQSEEKEDLLNLYWRSVDAFAGESSFLGVHNRRLYGFTELGTKVGRIRKSYGAMNTWKRRVWYHIDHAARAARLERMCRCKTFFQSIKVQDIVPLKQGEGGHKIVFNTRDNLIYRPGDAIAILPENKENFVSKLLETLKLYSCDLVPIQNESWRQSLADRGIEPAIEDGVSSIFASDFMRFASFPLNAKQLLDRIQNFLETDNYVPYILDKEVKNEVSKIHALLEALSATNQYQRNTLLQNLDFIFDPLSPRFYSIGSNRNQSSKLVEIHVGRVQYEEKSTHSFKLDSDIVSTITTPKVVRIALSDISNTTVHQLQKWNRLQTTEKKEMHHEVIQGISSSFLTSRSLGSNIRARIIAQPRFRLSVDTNAPVIMIGLGTGVVPFISFLRELVHQKMESGIDSVPRKAWLILGVKSPDLIPFRDEIEEAVYKHKVAKLCIAFSRADVAICDDSDADSLEFQKGKRMHIQDLFKNNDTSLQLFWDMIESGAHVYTCGKPQLDTILKDIITDASQLYGSMSLRSTFSDSDKTEIGELSRRFPGLLAAEHRLHVSSYNSGKKAVSDRKFTPSQVAEHRTSKSTFVIFKKDVYDLTSFLLLHPGGAKILLDKAGRDMTDEFKVVHGREEKPIVAMMEPYRVGSLESFEGSPSCLKTFMEQWSVPILHEILEHRSVFKLGVNNYPELETPVHSRPEWKSQISTRAGKVFLTNKFWNVQEPDLFEFIRKSVEDSNLGKYLRILDPQGAFQDCCDSLATDICAIRDRFVRQKRGDTEGLSREGAEVLLKGYGKFFDSLVNVILDVQRKLEYVLKEAEEGEECVMPDIAQAVMASTSRIIRTGISDAYELIPDSEEF